MASRGVGYVIEALMDRHHKRVANIPKLPAGVVEPVLSTIAPSGSVDLALRKLGVSRNRFPSSVGASWMENLAWGADSFYAAARLMFSGQFVGAAAILRSQFERWAENIAFNCGVVHEEGESFGSFAARAWEKAYSVGPFSGGLPHEKCASGPYVIIGDGFHSHPGELMVLMSDLLHGRSSVASVVHWEASDLLAPAERDVIEVACLLSEVMILNLRHVRVCLATASGEPGIRKRLLSTVERLPVGEVPPELYSLLPLQPSSGLSPGVMGRHREAERAYELVMQGKRPAGRLYRDNEFAHLLFYERRARAAHWANKVIELEKEKVGAAFDLASIDARESHYVMASEMSGLISTWAKGSPLGDAAAVCSSALRSAYLLWLEDDDRAMAILRSLLEQCARLTVWSSKPERAKKLEGSSATTPKDWLNAAGYKRLAALNRALGEFAHTHARIRQGGARTILESIQKDAQGEHAAHTARGHALDSMSLLLMEECIKTARVFSPAVADAFLEISKGFGGEAAARDLEDVKNRVHAQRGASLGDPTFYRPPEWIFGR